jgi:hypothetical protein
MDMAKVDIRKLQLLNDRIAQTIDALNQVRMSVHGLQHTTAGMQQPSPIGYGGIGVTGAYPVPGVGVPFGAQPGQFAQPVNPYAQGLGQFGQGLGQVGQFGQGLGQVGQFGQGLGQVGQLPINPLGATSIPVGGLGHTSFEAIDPWTAARQASIGAVGYGVGIDPMFQVRLAQTFPFAGSMFPVL